MTGGATNTRVGTDGDAAADAAERNLIADNDEAGVRVSGAGTAGTVVAGNWIGLTAAGTAAVGDRQAVGVGLHDGATFTRVGSDDADPAERNVVVGPATPGAATGTGVWACTGDAGDNPVAGNFVGLTADGLTPVGHFNSGIGVASARNRIAGNVVGANAQFGVGVYGATAVDNAVAGNWVGLTAAGVAAGGNPFGGVILLDGGIVAPARTTVGGPLPADRNVISGSAGPGVNLFSPGVADTLVLNNFIGTDPTGLVAVGNFGDGVRVNAATNTLIRGNVVSGNNQIADGSSAVHLMDCSTGTLVGGSTPADRNVVSGNTAGGIFVERAGATIRGNSVGTDVTPAPGPGATSSAGAGTGPSGCT